MEIAKISKENQELSSKNYLLEKENEKLSNDFEKLENTKSELDIEIYELWRNEKITDKEYDDLLDRKIVEFPQEYHQDLEYSLEL